MAAKHNRMSIEWVGGSISMPAYVLGEGEPYRPEALIWMAPDGAVLGATVAKPGEVPEMAAESLQHAIEQPMVGRPHAPHRVRVASPDVAEALRVGHPDIAVICAPTPEVDGFLTEMREKMSQETHDQSYLSDEIGADAIAAFFRAAAALFRATPWDAVPTGESLVSVTIEKLGLHDVAMSVIGQMGESLGLVLFSSAADFAAYLDVSEAIERGQAPAIPPHFTFCFNRGAELAPELRKEIAEHHWEVGAENAYPWLSAIDSDLVARPTTAQELSMAESIALALPRLLSEKRALHAAWRGGEPMSRTHCVATHAGEIEVTLRVPYAPTGGPQDVLTEAGEQKLAELGPREDWLICQFAGSQDAQKLSDAGDYCHLIMTLAAGHFDTTIAALGAANLREIIFEIIPLHVTVDASEARPLIEEMRAFYRFLRREFSLEQADSCLRVLGGSAVKKLEAALSDPSKFGMGKSLLLSGREAGFDIDSTHDLHAWMRASAGMPLPPSVRLPSLDAPSPSAGSPAARAKKNKRKMTRNARKKNR